MIDELQKKLDNIFNYCEEIDNHLPKEEQTGYKMLPDILELSKGINQLQSNWNSLREWLEENYKDSQDIWYVKIINKMNELEGVDNN